MEAVVLRRVGFLAYSCPKQGQVFKPLAAPSPKHESNTPQEVLDTAFISSLTVKGTEIK